MTKQKKWITTNVPAQLAGVVLFARHVLCAYLKGTSSEPATIYRRNVCADIGRLETITLRELRSIVAQGHTWTRLMHTYV